MNEVENNKQFLIDIYINEYMEEIFYYCLKKTSNEDDAKDLLQDISLNVLIAISKIKIENLRAYVYKIANNRYAIWTLKKQKYKNIVELKDNLEIVAENNENEIDTTKINVLNRELAFIEKKYRNIIIEYYINNKKISEIASFYQLNANTIISLLARGREKLRKGMNMAREFGTKSFNPDMMNHATSGFQPTNLPDRAMDRKIPINILCEANNNPSTMEELSMQLGIALPYMEEEINLLLDAELLKKIDNKRYITNFFIAPKECQNEINNLCGNFVLTNYKKIYDVAFKIYFKYFNENEIYSKEDIIVTLIYWLDSRIIDFSFPKNIFCKFKRKDGGNWGIIGYEKGATSKVKAFAVSDSLVDDGQTTFEDFHLVHEYETFDRKRYMDSNFDNRLLKTLKNIATSSQDNNLSNVKELLDLNIVVEKDKKYYVNAIVMNLDKKIEIDRFIKELEEFNELFKMYKECIEECQKVIEKYSNKVLKEDFDYYCAMLTSFKSYYLNILKENGLYKEKYMDFAIYFD